MDKLLARRLETDEKFNQSLSKMVADYTRCGMDATNYWTTEFDAAHDMLMAYAPLSKVDMEKLEKGHPRRFILPMTATQITTMTTFISQMLFGQETPHKVEGRGAEDEVSAEMVNNLLRWNDEQQPTYLLGYLWVQDSLTFNRAVFYNHWAPIFKPQMVAEQVDDPEGDIDPATNQPVPYTRFRRARVAVGGYNKMDLVSPYDFFCDPTFPAWRLQEGRFAGHRFKISWADLERRSKLPMDHPSYVLPSAVKKLKDKKKPMQSNLAPAISSSGGVSSTRPDQLMSRSQFERMRVTSPLGNEAADDKDPGVCDCVELWVQLVPSDYKLYGDEPTSEYDDESNVFQVTIGGGDTILSINESTYAHGMYPYSIGEGRPNGHYQFSPGWAFMLKGLQDYVDFLKNKHQEAVARTVGNVFIADPSKVDLEDFLDPEKEGLIISLKPAAQGAKIGDVIQQVPIKDMTERFHEEMMDFVSYSQTVTGANNSMQGAGSPEDNPSATEFAGTQQMSAGRMASIARLLSVQGLVPQTKQFVSNFQQFLEDTQTVRFRPTTLNIPPAIQGAKSLNVSSDSIQGDYDFVAHDGTLPGTDTKRVAAIAKVLEAAALFPQVFMPAPGNLDPRQLIFAGSKASGLNPENFTYTPQSIAEMTQGTVAGATGIIPQVEPGGGPPVSPPGQTPGPAPATPNVPPIGDLSLPSVGAPQARPSNT